jgi:hypothetical protein
MEVDPAGELSALWLHPEMRNAVSIMQKRRGRRCLSVAFGLLPMFVFVSVDNLPDDLKTSPFPDIAAVHTMQ